MEILYWLSGISAAKEETAHDTGTEYLLGVIKSIRPACIQRHNSYQCTAIKCLFLLCMLGK